MNFITILQVLGLDASLNRLTNPLGIFGDVFKSYSVQILSWHVLALSASLTSL